MKSSSFRLRLIAVAALFAIAVVAGYFIIRPSEELPIYNPSQLDPRLVGDEARGDTGVHHILPFHLIDQDGDSVSMADVKGKVVLADFFFTTCGSICPKMSTQLIRVQAKYKDEDRLMLLSHSVTPETDSVPVLKAYAEKYGVDHKRWRLMTGDRVQIYRLARNSYFAAVDEGDGGPDDFVHTENFVLVDPLGRIRGFYDGTKPDQVDQAMLDIQKLLDKMPS